MHEGIRNGTIPAICIRCHGGPRLGDPWEAGHLVDAVFGGGPEIGPEHRSCNRRAGAQTAAKLKKLAADRRAAAKIEETAQWLRGRSA